MTDESIAFFDGLAAETWAKARTDEDSAAEAAYLLSRLALDRPGRLLDVPCGDGRLARAVSAHGNSLTGIDASRQMLARAEESTPTDGDWRVGDMATLGACLPERGAFDGAYCFGNAVGYHGRTATAGFLAAVSAALKPAARFVIETEMTAESVLPNFADRLWQQVDDVLMTVEHRYEVATSQLVSDYRFIRGDRSERRRLVHTVFSCGALVEMLEAAAFDVVAMESDLDGTPFSLGDHRLLITASRR